VLKSVQDAVSLFEPFVLEIEDTYKHYPGTVQNEQIITDSINLLRGIRTIVIEGHNFNGEPKSIFSFFSKKVDNTLSEAYICRVNERMPDLETLAGVIKTHKENSTL
jgi:hypothetical protein